MAGCKVCVKRFCFIFSLEAGATIISFIILTLAVIMIYTNSTEIFVGNAYHVFIPQFAALLGLMFATAFFLFLSAYFEQCILGWIALILYTAMVFVWLTYTAMSFSKDWQYVRLICFNKKCGDSMWMMKMWYRVRPNRFTYPHFSSAEISDFRFRDDYDDFDDLEYHNLSERNPAEYYQKNLSFLNSNDTVIFNARNKLHSGYLTFRNKEEDTFKWKRPSVHKNSENKQQLNNSVSSLMNNNMNNMNKHGPRLQSFPEAFFQGGPDGKVYEEGIAMINDGYGLIYYDSLPEKTRGHRSPGSPRDESVFWSALFTAIILIWWIYCYIIVLSYCQALCLEFQYEKHLARVACEQDRKAKGLV